MTGHLVECYGKPNQMLPSQKRNTDAVRIANRINGDNTSNSSIEDNLGNVDLMVGCEGQTLLPMQKM